MFAVPSKCDEGPAEDLGPTEYLKQASASSREEGIVAAAYDLAIIGGGINGCGIARDAAGRGLTVHLCEMGDLAGGTSSRSTKLIHGGLRYLEHYDFRLVREALREREVLWRIAPHIVAPLRFVLPYRAGLRPAWLLRLGLFVYDHLGGRKLLPPTRILDLARDPGRRAAQARRLPHRLRIFRLPGRRCAAGACSTPAMPPRMARPSAPAPGQWRRRGAPPLGRSPSRTP